MIALCGFEKSHFIRVILFGNLITLMALYCFDPLKELAHKIHLFRIRTTLVLQNVFNSVKRIENHSGFFFFLVINQF